MRSNSAGEIDSSSGRKDFGAGAIDKLNPSVLSIPQAPRALTFNIELPRRTSHISASPFYAIPETLQNRYVTPTSTLSASF
jgi:hypothetical protein